MEYSDSEAETENRNGSVDIAEPAGRYVLINYKNNNKDNNSESNGEENPINKSKNKLIKKKKRGIIYLSTIPKHMTVTILREMLSQYGDVGRIFLQPSISHDDNTKLKKKKRNRFGKHFTEGWVEFESKRVAKIIAEKLNNTSMATRKSSKFYDILWCIKYLPRFKWVHLSERLTYEKAVYKQRLQTEISQARREATFFQSNLDKSEMLTKQKKKEQKIKS